jgi:hypothetical protein
VTTDVRTVSINREVLENSRVIDKKLSCGVTKSFDDDVQRPSHSSLRASPHSSALPSQGLGQTNPKSLAYYKRNFNPHNSPPPSLPSFTVGNFSLLLPFPSHSTSPQAKHGRALPMLTHSTSRFRQSNLTFFLLFHRGKHESSLFTRVSRLKSSLPSLHRRDRFLSILLSYVNQYYRRWIIRSESLPTYCIY